MISTKCPHDEVDTEMQEIEVTEANGIATTSLSSTSLLSTTHSQPPTPRNQYHADKAKQALLAMLALESSPPSLIPRRPRVIAPPITTSCQSNPNTLHTNLPINNSDRTKMCSWYYEMSNFLKISPSTASRAMYYLDRFMGCDSPHAATAFRLRDEYQLVALTALFIAIKLYDRLNIMPCHVSYLSRGRYTSEEVISMEIVILKSLEWKVTSANKLDYAELILDFILPKLSVCDGTLDAIRDLTSLQIQLSDFYAVYSNSMQSMVALAAVMNAYEVKKDTLLECDQEVFRSAFDDLLSRYDRDGVHMIMDKLCRLVDPSSEKRPSDDLTSFHQHSSPNTSTYTTCEESSLENFDAALETMEEINCDWLPHPFLCCGSIPLATTDTAMESDATQVRSSINMSPGSIGNSQSFDSRGSIKIASQKKESSKPSPTSIATMLFGKKS